MTRLILRARLTSYGEDGYKGYVQMPVGAEVIKGEILPAWGDRLSFSKAMKAVCAFGCVVLVNYQRILAQQN